MIPFFNSQIQKKMNITVGTSTYNKAIVGMFQTFPTKEDMFMKHASDHEVSSYNDGRTYGFYEGSMGNRTVTCFSGERVGQLKNLAAHMLLEACDYNQCSKNIALGEKVLPALEHAPMYDDYRDFAIEAVIKHRDRYCLDKSESLNALFLLYALLLLDFDDLPQEQKIAFLVFLNSQRKTLADDPSPTDIIDNSRNDVRLQRTCEETYLAINEKRFHESFISTHFDITGEGLGIHPRALHSRDLKPMELPEELEAEWQLVAEKLEMHGFVEELTKNPTFNPMEEYSRLSTLKWDHLTIGEPVFHDGSWSWSIGGKHTQKKCHLELNDGSWMQIWVEMITRRSQL